MCDQCSALSRALAARERELAQTRRRLARLQRSLQRVQGVCAAWQAEVGPILARRSGVKRGVWAYCRGAGEVLETVVAALQAGE